MAVNDTFHENGVGIADAADFTVDASSTGTGAAEVFEIAGGGAATIYKEVDTNDDGTYNVTLEVDSFSSAFHSQKNQIVISQANNTRLKITNDSGASADFFVTGMEVDD